MEYLNRVLGIHVIYKDDKITSMPNFIHARYRMQQAALDGKDVVFLYPKADKQFLIHRILRHIKKGLCLYKVPDNDLLFGYCNCILLLRLLQWLN